MWIQKLLVTAIIFITVVIGVWGGYAEAPVEAAEPHQPSTDFTGFRIYFSETRGEASRFDRSPSGISRFAGLLTSLGAELYTLEWRTGIPSDADLIIIAGPLGDLSDDLIARLWVYLKNGGRLLLLADPQPQSERIILPVQGTLFSLTWEDMGMRAQDDVVVTEGPVRLVQPLPTDSDGEESASASAIEVATVQTEFTTRQLNETHPITAQISSEVAFFVTRSLELDTSSADLQVTPLVFSDSDYFGETELQIYQDAYGGEYDEANDTPRGNLPLAAAFTDPTTQTRIVLLGDREFAVNGSGLQTSPWYSMAYIYPGNVHFLLNSVAWLLDTEIEPMTFPTPTPVTSD